MFKKRHKIMPMMRSRRRSTFMQQGETLIEALIAIFVLSLAVLGLMLVQLRSVDSVLDAQNQAAVVRWVENFAEFRKSNPVISVVQTASGDGSNQFIALGYQNRFAPNDNINCLADITTGNATAPRLQPAVLNSATVTTCTVDTNGNITVAWQGQDAAASAQNFTYTLLIQ